MRNFFKMLIVATLLVPALRAQDKDKSDSAKAADLRFSVDMLDKSIDPCNDFYAYACSKWMAQNPIPSDRPTWGRFNELAQRGEYVVRDILEKAAVDRAGRSLNEQKIGDYYASCMDEGAIEKAGAKPLEHDLESIAAIKAKEGLAREIVRLHREGADVLFSFDSDSDFKNASQMIAEVDQGGLGLPDRDYYFKDDAKSVDLRKKYVEHVAKMFVLLGDDEAKAASEAKVVMEIETGLAKGSLDSTSRRDPQKLYHKISDKELAGLSPAFDWNVYFEGVGAPHFNSLNVTEPDFFKNMQELIGAHSLDDWKTYLRWHAVHASAAMLPTAFVNENFDFYSKTLTGTKELRPRWKRCCLLYTSLCPGPGYLWTPGYWAWNDGGGYYWVPGTWVVGPVGMLWTPGYWGFAGGFYGWHGGYWGPHVGFYGGINYGFGYGGVGFGGGEWKMCIRDRSR